MNITRAASRRRVIAAAQSAPMLPMSSPGSKETREIDFRILRLVHENPNITQRELAEALGVSLGKVNYCFRALIEKGHMKIENFQNSDHRLAYLYLLTPRGMAQKALLLRGFLKKKIREYELLEEEIKALQQEVAAAKRKKNPAPSRDTHRARE